MQELEETNKITTPIWSTPKGEYITRATTNENRFRFNHKLDLNKDLLWFEQQNTADRKHLKNQLVEETSLTDNKANQEFHFENEHKFINPCVQNENLDKSYDRDEHLNQKQKKRDDVVNKTILRAIRRFYLKLFKRENPKLVRKRFRNVRSNVFYEAIQKMVKKHIAPQLNSDSHIINKLSYTPLSNTQNCGNEHNKFYSLIVFLFRFIGFKSKDNRKYRNEDEERGQQIQSWMYNYSNPKFIKVWSIEKLWYWNVKINYKIFSINLIIWHIYYQELLSLIKKS